MDEINFMGSSKSITEKYCDNVYGPFICHAMVG
jgi:hypothetical protein